jgi:hypothetical protein
VEKTRKQEKQKTGGGEKINNYRQEVITYLITGVSILQGVFQL